jgi:hypothetical protein
VAADQWDLDGFRGPDELDEPVAAYYGAMLAAFNA